MVWIETKSYLAAFLRVRKDLKVRRLIYLLFPFILFTACQSDSGAKKNTETGIWAETEKVYLDDERISIKLPASFKRSSRYRVEQDLPKSGLNKKRMELFQNALEAMEFSDGEIDFFVDTTTNFRVLSIFNTDRIDFNKKDGEILNALMSKSYSELLASTPGLKIDQLDSKMKNNDKLTIMKFKHKFDMKNPKQTMFVSLYYVNTSVQTIILHELSDKEADVEDYLWSLKD